MASNAMIEMIAKYFGMKSQLSIRLTDKQSGIINEAFARAEADGEEDAVASIKAHIDEYLDGLSDEAKQDRKLFKKCFGAYKPYVAVQTYSSDNDCDMLVIKVKSSSQPLDIKRMSYTLTHTSFFRVLGFDWYSKTPKGKYRCCYGRNISSNFDFNENSLNDFAKQVFGNNSIFLSAMIMNKKFANNKDEYINNMINIK